jgi:predicted small lipoprotein YifL
MSGRSLPAIMVLAFVAAGCGYKGPLTLPPKTGPVVTRPASATQPTTPSTAQPGAAQPATAPATPPKPEGGGE